jgi:hypothetical protein
LGLHCDDWPGVPGSRDGKLEEVREVSCTPSQPLVTIKGVLSPLLSLSDAKCTERHAPVGYGPKAWLLTCCWCRTATEVAMGPTEIRRHAPSVPLWRFQNMPRNARAADGGDGWDAGLTPRLGERPKVRKCEIKRVHFDRHHPSLAHGDDTLALKIPLPRTRNPPTRRHLQHSREFKIRIASARRVSPAPHLQRSTSPKLRKCGRN